jgi:hypothetical protein
MNILSVLKKKLEDIQSAISDNQGFIRQGKPTIEPIREAISSWAQANPQKAQAITKFEPAFRPIQFTGNLVNNTLTKTIPTFINEVAIKPGYELGKGLGGAIASNIEVNRMLDTQKKQFEIADRYQQMAIKLAKTDPQKSRELFKRAQDIYNQQSREFEKFEKPLQAQKEKTISSGIKVGQSILGAGFALRNPLMVGLGGLIQGGIGKAQGRDFFEEAGKGMGATIQASAVFQYTNPLISGLVGKSKTFVNNPLAKQLLARAVGGLGNVTEDEFLARLDRRDPTSLDRLTSFAIGALVASGGDIEDWNRLKKETKDFLIKAGNKLNLDTRPHYEVVGIKPEKAKSADSLPEYVWQAWKRMFPQDRMEAQAGFVRIGGDQPKPTIKIKPQETTSPLSPIGEMGGGGEGGMKPPKAPETVPQPPLKERQFFQTVEKAKSTPEEILGKTKESAERYYQPKSNPELLKEASKIIDDLGVEKATKAFFDDKVSYEKAVALGDLLARKAFSEGRWDEGFKIVEEMAKKGTRLGRGVQSFAIWSRLTPEGMLNYADKLLKQAEENYKKSFTGKIFKKVDFNLTNDEKKMIYDLMQKAMTAPDDQTKGYYSRQALKIISEKIPFGVSEILDVYRFNNMLSGPLTHLKNFFSNLFQTYFNLPLTLATSGKPKQALEYEVNAIKNVGRGLDAFIDTFLGKTPTDLSKTETIISEAKYQRIPRALRISTDLMESADMFFQNIIKPSLIATGMKEEEAAKLAEEFLFRKPMSARGYGIVSDSLRAMGEMLEFAGRKFKPIRWFVPFIRTPFNFAAAQVEYSPIGFANLIGAEDKRMVLSKALIGSVLTSIGTTLALQNRVTWAPPTDPEEKKYFYASGKKPFSIEINGKWIPAAYFGPYALSLLLPAAVKYQYEQSPDALSEEDWKKLTKTIGSVLYFWSQSTPMSGLGGFVRTLQGDIDWNVIRNLGYTAQQVIPYNSLLRWISNFVDDIYRKPKTFGEQFISGIPFLTKTIKEYYQEPTGEPARRLLINQFLPYSIGIEKDTSGIYNQLLQERQQERQTTRYINQLKKKMEEGEELSPQELQLALQSQTKKEPTTPLEALRERAKLEASYKKANHLFELYIKADREDVRTKIEQNVRSMGLDFEEGLYNYLSNQDSDARKEFILASIKGIEDRQKMIEALALFRKKSIISSKKLLTDNLIDELYDEGIITESEKRYLKSIKGTQKEGGKVKIKTSEKSKKIKIGKPPALRVGGGVRIPKVRISTGKISRGYRLKPPTIKIAKRKPTNYSKLAKKILLLTK